LFFISFPRHQAQDEQSPPGVSVVFDNGGAQQQTAPKPQIQGPPQLAQAPAPAAPPPPDSQPEVRLDMPQMPVTTQPAPAPSHPHPAQRETRRTTRQPPSHYTVMNDLSFGHPAPPIPFQHRALNLDLSQSDANAENGPELTIKGDVGADWNAALDQWVEDHKYYPDSAIEQGQQGDVRIHFTVDRAGNVTGLHMVSGSGSPFLDQAWLGLFEDAQLPPFPPGTKANTVTVDATMHFVLEP
jgi:protein TonB